MKTFTIMILGTFLMICSACTSAPVPNPTTPKQGYDNTQSGGNPNALMGNPKKDR